MESVMVRYKVRPESAAENEALIRNVFDELRAAAPDGVRYASFKLDDGVSFVHIASFDSPDGNTAFNRMPAFRAFVERIKDRCEIPPEVSPLRAIGNHGLF